MWYYLLLGGSVISNNNHMPSKKEHLLKKDGFGSLYAIYYSHQRRKHNAGRNQN